jgi:hypothetical protein
MESDFLSSNPSEGEVYAGPMNEDSVEIAREVPGVDTVEGFSTISGDLIQPDGKKISIQFTAIEDPYSLTLNTLKPVQGATTIPPLYEKEVLIDSSPHRGYQPGDTMVIELSDGKRRELRLGGYLHAATGFPYNLAQTIGGYVTPDTLVWLGGTLDYDMLAVSVAEKQTDAEHVTQVAQAVADRLERSGATVYYVNVYQPGHHFAYNISQGMFAILGA